jgi:phosphate transport system substrate-binding protein
MVRDAILARARMAWTPILALTTALTVTLASERGVAETLVIEGSTTFNRRIMEPLRSEIEAASGHELTVIPNKSTPGLIGLMEGRAQMAMISAPLATEIGVLEKIKPGLRYDRLRVFRISATQVAIGVHSSNPVRNATIASVEKILVGEIKNWNELGGPDLPIRIVLVGGGGGLTIAVEGELLRGRQVSASNLIQVQTPVQLVQVVEQERGSIGFAQLALVKQRGIPQLSTERPIEQVLSLVTLGDPTPAMQSVIDATRRIAEKMM